MLEIRCSWCGKHLGWKDGKGQSGITNTICETCKKEVLNEISNNDCVSVDNRQRVVIG